MNKQQFLNELRQCLDGEVSPQVIQDNLSYYDQYFREQMASGKSEDEIAAELGNPILTARTIIDAASAEEGSYYEEAIYTEDGEEAPHSQDGFHTEVHSFELKWYHKLLFVLIIVAVVSFIFTITSAILSFAAPILLVVLLIYLIRRLFR